MSARAHAERDPRNYLSLVASLAALRPEGSRDPRFLFNFYATVIQTESDQDEVKKGGGVVVTKDYILKKEKVRRAGDWSRRIGVKIFAGGVATGDALRTVTVVHDGDALKPVWHALSPSARGKAAWKTSSWWRRRGRTPTSARPWSGTSSGRSPPTA